jgi:hypothetical protein
MFSTYSMGSHIVHICCVEFQTFRLINCSVFDILTTVFSEIIYEPVSSKFYIIEYIVFLTERPLSTTTKRDGSYKKKIGSYSIVLRIWAAQNFQFVSLL